MNINSVRINEEANKILIDITAEDLSSVSLWTSETFKNPSQAINLNYLIPVPSGNNYIFAIDFSDVSLVNFTGLFFIEFQTPEETEMAVAANLVPYQECVLEKVLSMDIQGCKGKNNSCKECEEDALGTQLLLDTLYISIQHSLFEEAVRILSVLDEDCGYYNNCSSCKNTQLVSGFGFGTLNNSITLL